MCKCTMTERRLTKLATLADVPELTEGEPTELWLTAEGRVVVRAFNECRNAYTELDLLGVIAAAKGLGAGL